jgi:hypothetical protein
LYIKMDPSLAIPAFLGLPILPDILRMIMTVLGQVSGMLIEPGSDAGVVISAILRIVRTPAGIGILLMAPLARGVATGFLAVAHGAARKEGGGTDTTRFPLHAEPPGG